MPIRGREIRMHGLVRQIQEERFSAIAPFQPLHRVVGQFVGNVALLRNAVSVDVDRAAVNGEIVALSGETDPVIESRLFFVAVQAHMPLSHIRGLVTGRLQVLRKEAYAGTQAALQIVDHAVRVGIEAGEDGSAARRA